MIYCTWIMYLGGLAYLLATARWAYAAGWLVGVPLVEWYYIRNFSRFSPVLGYGKIADEAASGVAQSQTRVIFYTALGCPFCPLMEQRLRELQAEMGFSMEKIDVTLRPELLISKGIRSVPAIEAGDHVLFGLITKKDMAAAITPI